MDGGFLIFAVLGLLCVSAFFSGSETALTATSRARMHKLEQDGNKRAMTVNALINNPERLLGAILLGNNLVNILASALATTLFLSLFGESGVLYATAVMTALVVVFAEVLPKTAAISRPDGFAMVVSPVMRVIVFLFAPVTGVVQFIVRRALRLLGLNIEESQRVLSAADELRGAIDLHHEEGRVEGRARDILRGALDLEEVTLEEVMVHRKNITMLDISEPCEKLVTDALDCPHTRLPLWKDNPENIVGVLHAKDLLRAWWEVKGDIKKLDIHKIARKPYFVPETTPLTEQLDAFKRKKEHFALVVDEYGALMGLVTLEDIIEEIVGEIEDEHDITVRGVRPQANGAVNVDGDVTIRDLNKAMDWSLPDDEAVTVAGLVIHESQSIPEPGQTFSFYDFRFEIVRRHRNQVTALRVTPLAPEA